MSEQLVTPMSTRQQPQLQYGESMTFSCELSRDQYARQQRAYGWEVFFSYQGTNQHGLELYSVTRRAL